MITCAVLRRRPLLVALMCSFVALASPAHAQAERALVNISQRTFVGTGDAALYANFQVEGTAAKSILIRAVGPTLSAFGIPGALSDPLLQVYSANGGLLATNDDWSGNSAVAQASANVGAFALASAASKDSALVLSAPPGVYTVRVSGVGTTTGEALIEVYDTETSVRLPFLATRSLVSAGGTQIVGLSIAGVGNRNFLIRALGPNLAAAGITGALANPAISVFSASTSIAANDNWGSAVTASALVSAGQTAGLRPLSDSSTDAALLLSLAPGSYSVQLSGVGGTSGIAQVEIAQIDAFRTPFAPALVVPVESGTVFAGSTRTFSAAAIGNPTPTHQWRRNGTPIAGATNAFLTLTNITTADVGNYSVVLTNSVGTTVSADYGLSVFSQAPFFNQSPASQSVFAGQVVTLTSAASGTPTPSYQWRKAGTPVAGATNATLVFNPVQLGDAGSYDVVATNSVGSATSASATLTVTSPVAPAIMTQPAGAVLNVGNVGNLGVVATGTPSPAYQWRKDGTPLSGATQNVLRLGQVVESQAGTYDVVVSNLAGSVTSASAVLVINPASISILSQPVSLSTWLGAAATFSITATGIPGAPTYQWRKNAVNIPGATASTLSFSAVQLADAGTYDVVATNGYVTLTSASANLAITDAAPVVLTPPAGFTLAVGGSATLSVNAGGSAPLAYQWRRGSFTLPGATTATLTLTNAQTFDAGDYTVTVTNGLGSVTSAVARVNVVPRVVAYSARVILDDPGAVATFVIEGALPKKVLLRAVGPGLAPFGLTGLPDPALELFDSSGNLLALNDDWSTSADAVQIASTAAAVGAFALAQGGKDAALVRTLAPGAYTVRARPATGAGGIGYLELYDADLATGPLSTVPFVAVRGRMAAGGGVVIGGLGSNGRGQRSYLLRAVGPGLGLAGALADPALLVVRDSALVGQNDNWDAVPADATAVATATSRVAAFPLTTASRDAGIVLTGNLHVGSATAQINGADNLDGLVLVELHDLDAARPTRFRPVIVSPPVPTTAVAGNSATLRVRAHGTEPLGYQWHRNGVPVAGATADTLVLAGVTGSVAGPYTVTVANSLGSSTSLAALLTVTSATDTSTASHAVIGGGYAAGAPVTISAQLVASAGASALGWSVDLPPGWSYVSDTATSAAARPAAGATGTIEWAWSEVPAGGTLNFTFTASVPSGSSGDRTVTARGLVRFESGLVTTLAAPSPLVINQLTSHTADLNADNRLDLAELLRVIQLYNARAGGVRTGAYAVATTTSEDGFAPDLVRTGATTLTRYHSADTTRDGRLNLVELTRVIELYNVRAGTVRTGLYKIQPGTEDGFGLGP